MPTYNWRCPLCERPFEGYRTVASRHDAPMCSCGTQARLVIVAPMIRPDIPAYQSPIDGRAIESRRQRTEDFKRNNSRPWEGMEQEKKEAARHQQYADQKEEKVLDKVANEAYHELPPSKRDALKWLTEHS